MLMVVIYILLAVLVIIFILGLISPKTYHVSRSIIIDRPSSEVFNYLKYLKNQDAWSPWQKRDPDMEKEFIGIDGEPGFISKWNGNKQVGVGEQEIKHILEGKRIETELRFFKPWKSTSNAFLAIEPLGENQTQVNWGFDGENNFMSRLFMIFMDMDKMIGKDFEEGLLNLKLQLEKK